MRGDKFMKAVVVTLVCIVAAYLVFSFTRVSGESFTIYKAVRFEVGDGITTSGFLVRYEQLLDAPGEGVVVLDRSEGEKVGKGQDVATVFLDESARERQARIEALEAAVEGLRRADAFASTDVDSTTLDRDILDQMTQIARSASRRDYSAAGATAESLKPYVLRRYITGGNVDVLRNRLTAAQNQLVALYAEAGAAKAGSISAPESGYFSARVDGYEAILTPAFLETATVSALEKYEGIGRLYTEAIGKLVMSPKWYFASIVPLQNVETLRVGDRIDVSFAFDFYEPVRMKIERISPSENERCILVLSSESYIQNAVSSRTETADLMFSSVSGLRIPKTAIYVNEEGESGVYVLVGAEATWKPIEILFDDGDCFIVKLDKSSTKNLWPDDAVILTTGEMFNGKVMVQ